MRRETISFIAVKKNVLFIFVGSNASLNSSSGLRVLFYCCFFGKKRRFIAKRTLQLFEALAHANVELKIPERRFRDSVHPLIFIDSEGFRSFRLMGLPIGYIVFPEKLCRLTGSSLGRDH